MRHRVAGRKLSRHTKHRELMFRNMLVSLLEHQRIRTTLAKAKELRRWAEKIITVAKKNSLHARRLAFALLRDEGTVKKLFQEIAPQYKDRQGGYTRIYKMGWRQGDNAPMSLIELVTLSAAPEKKKKKSAVKKAKEVLEKVTSPKRKEKGGVKAKGETAKKEKKEKKGEKVASGRKPKVKPSEEKGE
jgi:large subunit ribosomal protein L17